MNDELQIGPCVTGDECPKSGIWYCSGHPAIQKYFHSGDVFPNCWQGAGHRTTWIYER